MYLFNQFVLEDGSGVGVPGDLGGPHLPDPPLLSLPIQQPLHLQPTPQPGRLGVRAQPHYFRLL